MVKPDTRQVHYASAALTENTRASYPINYIDNARLPCRGPHPRNVVLLCCDAFGVLPPVSRLTLEQAMYHFISGYTSKVRRGARGGAGGRTGACMHSGRGRAGGQEGVQAEVGRRAVCSPALPAPAPATANPTRWPARRWA